MKRLFIYFFFIFLTLISITLALDYVLKQLTLNVTLIVTQPSIEIYKDSSLTQLLTYIDWGVLFPGESKTVTCYILNNKDSSVSLNITTDNWSPYYAKNFIFVGWNYTVLFLNRVEFKPVEILLNISKNIENVTSFSFDIIIYEVVI